MKKIAARALIERAGAATASLDFASDRGYALVTLLAKPCLHCFTSARLRPNGDRLLTTFPIAAPNVRCTTAQQIMGASNEIDRQVRAAIARATTSRWPPTPASRQRTTSLRWVPSPQTTS